MRRVLNVKICFARKRKDKCKVVIHFHKSIHILEFLLLLVR